MMSIDKVIICCDCNESFAFTAGEQQFFGEKGLRHEPKRCPNCRVVVRAQRSASESKPVCDAVCSSCGAQTKVPFIPRGFKPIYCNICFVAIRENQLTAV